MPMETAIACSISVMASAALPIRIIFLRPSLSDNAPAARATSMSESENAVPSRPRTGSESGPSCSSSLMRGRTGATMTCCTLEQNRISHSGTMTAKVLRRWLGFAQVSLIALDP